MTTSGDPSWLWISAPGTFAGGAALYGYVPVSAGLSFNVLLNSNVLSQLSNGAHNGTITITDYPGGNQATVYVVLNVNNGASCTAATGGLTVSPSSIQLPAVSLNSTTTVTSSATVSSSVTGTFANYYPSTSGSCNGISAVFSSTNLVGGGSGITMTVYGSASGNSSVATTETCYLYLNLLSGSTTVASATIPVTWTIGSGGSGGGGVSNPVLPTSLSFATENNSAWFADAAVGHHRRGRRLERYHQRQLDLSGRIRKQRRHRHHPGFRQSCRTCDGNIALHRYRHLQHRRRAAGRLRFPLGYFHAGALRQSDLRFQPAGGQRNHHWLRNPFQVLASDSSAISFAVTTSDSWIVASPSSGNTTNNSVVSFSINPANLANGVYSGNIIITASGAANSPLTVPIVLTVSGSSASGGGGTGSLTYSPTALTFNAQVGGAAPAAQQISVSDPSGIYYLAQANGTNSGITWLFVSPAQTYINGSQAFTVTVNQTGLALGTYTGTVSFVDTSGNSQSATITLNVTTTGGGTSSASSSPSSLNFSANQGGARSRAARLSSLPCRTPRARSP